MQGPLLDQPPQLTPQQQQLAAHPLELPGPALPIDPHGVPVDVPPTQVDQGQRTAPGDFSFFQDAAVGSGVGGSLSTAGSTSGVSDGAAVFQTGNFYASVNGNYGDTGRWKYINPATLFPATGNFSGGFFGNQRVAHDPNPSRDLTLWTLEYYKTNATATGTNGFRLVDYRSRAGLLTNSFTLYEFFSPAFFGLGAGKWLNYTHLETTANFLYGTQDVFQTTNDTFVESLIWRVSLSDLKAGGTIGVSWYTTPNFSLALTSGAGTTMYAFTPLSSTSVRIYHWDDGGNLASDDITGLGATYSGTHISMTPGGINWTQRSDERIQTAWVGTWAGGVPVVGALWNSAQGAGRPQPFMRGLVVQVANLHNVVSQPDLFSANYAYHYGSVAPNARGHIAGPVLVGGGTFGNPGTTILIADDFSGFPSGWTNFFAEPGNSASTIMGDFLGSQRSDPASNTWVGSYYAIVNGVAQHVYGWYGRERDRTRPQSLLGLNEAGDTLGTATNTGIGVGGGTYGIDARMWDAAFGEAHVGIYRFQTVRGAVISAQTSLPSGGDAMDTYMRLFDSTGAQLAFNDDCGGTAYSCIAYKAPADGIYYVGISGNPNRTYNPNNNSGSVNGSQGDYGFTLAVTPPIPDRPLTGTAKTINVSEGQIFFGVVASFTDADPRGVATDYTARIDWHNGLVTAGTITANGAGGFNVSGENGFGEEGTATATVTITDINDNFDAGGATAVVNSTFNISDSGLSGFPIPYNSVVGTEGFPITNLPIIYWFDGGGYETPSSYTVTINWGDGNTTAGTVATGPVWTINGSHTYVEEGTYTTMVTIRDEGGSTVVVPAMLSIQEASLAPTATPVSATEGTAFTSQVGTFVDAGGPEPVDHYSATIDWGDGTPIDNGIIGMVNATTFSVTGSHTYAEEGAHTVLVVISHEGTVTCNFYTTSTVADASLSGAGINVTATEGTVFNGLVANFQDAGNADPITSYSASIDWGDGNVSAGLITPDGSGGFNVTGTNTYAEEGSYTVTVTITDEGGSTLMVTGTTTVGDAVLSGVGTGLSGTAGVPLSGVQVAVFDDAGGPEDPSQYTAQIDWGDMSGLDPVGTITPVGTEFSVSGSHTYATDGTYTVTVTITDEGGSSVVTMATATIAASGPSPSTLLRPAGVPAAHSGLGLEVISPGLRGNGLPSGASSAPVLSAPASPLGAEQGTDLGRLRGSAVAAHVQSSDELYHLVRQGKEATGLAGWAPAFTALADFRAAVDEVFRTV
jgi:hypothetical protein